MCSWCQVRRIVCGWLATVLRVTARRSETRDNLPSRNHSQDDLDALKDSTLDEGFTNHIELDPLATTRTRADPVLVDIRELLRRKDRREEEERMRLRGEAKLRQEWMLAARVVNRLCFIFFAVVIFATTFVFFFVFHLRH